VDVSTTRPEVIQKGLLTEFDLPAADYNAARADFVQREEKATKKVEQLKKDLGEKWDEVTGKKSGN
jgi:hypothetical protein